MIRRTKIVATIGPASSSEAVLTDLVDAGMNVARLGLAHGSVDGHLELIKRIRAVAADRGQTVGVLVDLPGPKIRTTDMGEGVIFKDHSTVRLSSGTEPSSAEHIYTDYPTCAQDLQVGDAVTLGDGGVDLRVTGVKGDIVEVMVSNGGQLRGRPGLHLPADRVTLAVPTDEDRELIKQVAITGNADFVAVSFVRDAAAVREVRSLLGDTGARIVAKIETPSALENLDEIVHESDAVMVARGDLGTECPFEDVPVYQKRIIKTCLANATPVITATQMLESMITASTPTRAEASDVANAVCDGTDAVMLSAESAVGHNPRLAVETMAKLAVAAENVADFEGIARSIGRERRMNQVTAALTHGAWYAVGDANAQTILCCTRSGATVHAMAALRPRASLIALSTSDQTVRQETLTWGATPMGLPQTTHSDAMVSEALRVAREAKIVHPGDVVAVLSGSQDVPGATNDLRLLTVDSEG